MRLLGAVVLGVLGLLAAGCGEPEPDLDVPARGTGERVLDVAGVLDASVKQRLDELAEATGADVVALAYEDDAASLGQADRAGRRLLQEWGADVVLVAVARPGDFTSSAGERARYFGVSAEDRFAVGRGTRERMVEEVVPPLAGVNDWPGAFRAAADVLAQELTDGAAR